MSGRRQIHSTPVRAQLGGVALSSLHDAPRQPFAFNFRSPRATIGGMTSVRPFCSLKPPSMAWLLLGHGIVNGAPFSYRNRTPHLYEIFLLRFVIWLLRAYKYRQLRPWLARNGPKTFRHLYNIKKNRLIGWSVQESREYGRFCLKVQFWYQQFKVWDLSVPCRHMFQT